MLMVSEEERDERLKLKLYLYGSYTREFEKLEHRYFEIGQEMAMNENMKNAARNLGIYSNDPYHSASEKLQLEYASIPDLLDQVRRERTYLGLDEFIEGLPILERKLIYSVYVNKKTYVESGDKLGMSKRTIQRMINNICKSWHLGTPETVL